MNFQFLFSFFPLKTKKSYSNIKNFQIEDLLKRCSFKITDKEVTDYLKEKNILITGAGGSIGRELVRQISIFKPKTIILFDIAETPLFEIRNELEKLINEKKLQVKIESFIGDIKNSLRLSYIFEKFEPKVVFHTAAYKHVFMMENNPCEAILNNLEGTKNLINIALKFQSEKFIFISTDKAVNPINIMGVSKRICELFIQNIDISQSKTKFITVRFGNVLDSNGSVVSIFREQIKLGGPITVTHPDMTRFFMTIPEAVQLVLQAGSMGNKNEIFVLDMGKSIKIRNLAEKMIVLSGLKPYKDIKIDFIGIRPGEKLCEELTLATESLKKTKCSRIFININKKHVSYNKNFLPEIERLIKFAKQNQIEQVLTIIQKIVPEYKKFIYR